MLSTRILTALLILPATLAVVFLLPASAIGFQIAKLMPKAKPIPNSKDPQSYAYWEKYIDYVISRVSVGENPPPPPPPPDDDDDGGGGSEPPTDDPPPPPPTSSHPLRVSEVLLWYLSTAGLGDATVM